MRPVLSERAPATEQGGRVVPDSVTAMISAGFTRMLQPRAYGGGWRTVEEFIDVCAALAQGCMSTGWCNFVWGVHNYLIALYPEAVRDRVWADPTALTAASLGPAGTVTYAEDGNADISGHWRFASGCDHADWLLLGCKRSADGEPQLALVEKSNHVVEGSWDVTGLVGTGSKDVRIDSAHVSADRLLPFSQCLVPYGGLLVLVVVAPLLGAAERAIELFTEQLHSRKLAASGKLQGDTGTAKLRLAEASAEVGAAQAIVRESAAVIDAQPRRDAKDTAKVVRDTAFAAKLCRAAVDRIFEASGGAALHLDGELQRIWRDVHAGSAHARLDWDAAADTYANEVLKTES